MRVTRWRDAGGHLALLLALTGVAPGVAAQERSTSESIQEVLGDSAQYRKVITAFQAAVRTHDPGAVAALVRYPITVTVIGKGRRTIRDSAAFVGAYDRIITPAIAAAVQGEKYDALMVNYQGVMLGNGEVWINGTCRDASCSASDVKVITIQPTDNAGPSPAR